MYDIGGRASWRNLVDFQKASPVNISRVFAPRGRCESAFADMLFEYLKDEDEALYIFPLPSAQHHASRRRHARQRY